MPDADSNEKKDFTADDYTHLTAEVLARMGNSWESELVARTAIYDFSGGTLTTKYMQNLDSANQGPPVKIRLMRKICYPKKELLEWIAGRVKGC